MERAGEAVLVLNAGSSSVKFALFEGGSFATLVRGQVERLGSRPRFAAPGPVPDLPPDAGHDAAIAALLAWLEERAAAVRVVAVGHRVVHGGGRFAAPVLLDGPTIAAIESFAPLAPLHQPHNLAAIRAVAARRPDLPQVACFDTAFHAGQPPEAVRLPLPRAWAERGLRRYGFHGLSYESIVARMPEVTGTPLPGRLVVAHLGNGASLAAVRDGHGIATTMGFSTLDGVPMGTRPGAIDPGVLLHLLEREGLSVAALRRLLYHESGLLGVSGISGDMRTLLASAAPEAAETIDWFCYRVAREVGSLAAALEGLDAIVFTGGIGERAAPVRARILERCRWLGVERDEDANEEHGPRISAAGSAVSAWVIATDEESVIARHTLARVR
jgi:acetate kinase